MATQELDLLCINTLRTLAIGIKALGTHPKPSAKNGSAA